MPPRRDVWLITGASSGFGRLMTEEVLSRGDIAVATLRTPSAIKDLQARYPPSQLLVLKLDVTQPSDITDAFSKTKEVFGRLDVVFNNAGYGILAEVESTVEEAARTMFDVNFWGADRVSREAVRFFREVNEPGVGGRLLVVSSMVGIKPFESIGYYSASKHALEALTQVLRGELDPEWNIKITSIEPGGFRTNATTSAYVSFPPHPAYEKPTLAGQVFRKIMSGLAERSADPAKAVRKFYELAKLENPPARLPLGKDAVEIMRRQLQEIINNINDYESWSEDLGFDALEND